MEYKTLDEIARAGEATPDIALTRAERLERWATALERRGSAKLRTLWRTEHAAPDVHPALRAENSPLTVAFEDPVLRIAGLSNDSYSEAKRFFELSDRHIHWVVCHCHFGQTMSAREAAHRVRSLAVVRTALPVSRWLLRMLLGARSAP
ncbi:MAG: hypothetical protein ACREIP_17315 [Alphaproteobacteria bacterium]